LLLFTFSLATAHSIAAEPSTLLADLEKKIYFARVQDVENQRLKMVPGLAIPGYLFSELKEIQETSYNREARFDYWLQRVSTVRINKLERELKRLGEAKRKRLATKHNLGDSSVSGLLAAAQKQLTITTSQLSSKIQSDPNYTFQNIIDQVEPDTDSRNRALREMISKPFQSIGEGIAEDQFEAIEKTAAEWNKRPHTIKIYGPSQARPSGNPAHMSESQLLKYYAPEVAQLVLDTPIGYNLDYDKFV